LVHPRKGYGERGVIARTATGDGCEEKGIEPTERSGQRERENTLQAENKHNGARTESVRVERNVKRGGWMG